MERRARIRRREYRAIAILLLFGAGIWVGRAVLDYYVERGSGTEWIARAGFLYYDLIIVSVGLVCFLAYGIYIFQILSEVRRTEKELQISEERHRLLTQNSLTGIYMHEKGRFIFVNERLAHMLGYSVEEMIGRQFTDFIFHEDLERFSGSSVLRSIKAADSPQQEFRVLCRNGALKWVEVLASTVEYQGRRVFMGNVADITDRKEVEAERERLFSDLMAVKEALHYQATHDALTGLLNRSAALDKMNRLLMRSLRDGQSMGLIMADLDHFKPINDSHGHLIGDEVLREIAKRIESCVRANDLVARYGGEEIIMALPGSNPEQTAELAERIRKTVSDKPVETHEGDRITVTISLGVTAANGNEAPDLDSMIRAADEALYAAKEAGRDCVKVSGSPARVVKDDSRFVFDSLTGLLNRAEILKALGALVSEAGSMKWPVGFILVDLDHFAGINDFYGPEVGDTILKEVGTRIRAIVRKNDPVGRFDGDAFLIGLANCDDAAAVRLAGRIKDAVSKSQIETPIARVPVTVSLGVTSTRRTGDSDTEAVAAALEEAVARAQQMGGNAVQTAEPMHHVSQA